MPDSPLKGSANILVCRTWKLPALVTTYCAFPARKCDCRSGADGRGETGSRVNAVASVRRIVNMVALAVVEAQTNRCNSFLTLTLTLNIQGKRLAAIY